MTTEGELDESLRKRLLKIANWLTAALMLMLIAGVIVDFGFPLTARVREMGAGTAVLHLAFIMLAPVAALRSIQNFVQARNRQLLMSITVFVMILLSVFYYGQFEYGRVSAQKTCDFAMALKDGHHVFGIMIAKLSDGIAYKFIGEDKLYYVPNDQIAALELLH
jgi:hypothetical protein